MEAKEVNSIHELGGTVLGSSRGEVPEEEMIETLIAEKVNILFTIGGDGTQRGAEKLFKEITRRKLPISVVGIPKTIDNDIRFIARTFGFDTAVEKARAAIASAHQEASSAHFGIGLVRLMGRDSGFIAAKATLASGDVNIWFEEERERERERWEKEREKERREMREMERDERREREREKGGGKERKEEKKRKKIEGREKKKEKVKEWDDGYINE